MYVYIYIYIYIITCYIFVKLGNSLLTADPHLWSLVRGYRIDTCMCIFMCIYIYIYISVCLQRLLEPCSGSGPKPRGVTSAQRLSVCRARTGEDLEQEEERIRVDLVEEESRVDLDVEVEA